MQLEGTKYCWAFTSRYSNDNTECYSTQYIERLNTKMEQNGNPRLALIGLSGARPWSSQMVGSEYSRLSSLLAASSSAVPGVPTVEGEAKLASGKEIWRKRSRGRDEELRSHPISLNSPSLNTWNRLRRSWSFAGEKSAFQRQEGLPTTRNNENGNISLPFLHDYDVKLPNLALYAGRKQETMNYYISLSELG